MCHSSAREIAWATPTGVSGVLASNHVKRKESQCTFLQFYKENDLFDLITGGIAGAILITAVGFNWTGYGLGWTLRSTAEQMVIEAAVAAPIQPDPMQMMINARDLPTQEFVDYTFVFN